MEFTREMERCRSMVETWLAAYFPGGGLQEAMRYSLMAGGKRIRPILTLKFCQAAGGTAESAKELACAVEMLHTYSLIHDDLPCMDDDDLRRGRPTCHKAFGECTATLAGDALQAAAFETALSSSAERAGDAARILAEAAGERGMCGGQYMDTEGTPHTLEELTEINDKKTGALLRAACLMGVTAAGGDSACMEAARAYAANLGLAFQIRDDILDATSTPEILGKNAGSDAANSKTTYVTLLGAEECERRVLRYTEAAKAALEQAVWRGDIEFLRTLADTLAHRDH